MLHLDSVNELNKGKNLLAFSAGVDSSALFFLLLENEIVFDIALVNYGLRKQSLEEEAYALALGEQYNLKVYTQKAPLFKSNFEKSARDFRYNFFTTLIEKHQYTNLITAHQLGDQLEWLLMRLTKGAGTSELVGLEPITQHKSHNTIRPILHHTKDELLDYLEGYGHQYFIDQSNSDEKYERNYFRKNFSDKLIEAYTEGIRRSFNYLREDKHHLLSGYKEIFNHQKLFILELSDPKLKVRVIDRYLKRLGYLLSSAQREEILNSDSIVMGGIWAIEVRDNLVYIAPYITSSVVMPKKYKEACRIAKIPPKVRGYCYTIDLEPSRVSPPSLHE
ncbi:MAG: tRNA lysidine(34) synthetase TilS [Epsilonproteobacteria bacterium]|nr:tRNA lysidine(34) synthetase TilS [Campylobacterota bacterium]